MENVRNFIDMVAQGQNAEAREALEDMLSTRAFDALDTKKKELASSVFDGAPEESEEA